MSDKKFTLHIRSVPWLNTLSRIILVLVALCVITQFYQVFRSIPLDNIPLSKFNLDFEANIPNFFSTVLLLIASGLLWLIAVIKKGSHQSFSASWMALAIIFLLMSLDEAASFHDMASDVVKNHMDVGGWFYFAWVLPAIGVVALFILVFLRFYLHFDRRFKFLFGGAAFLYLLGALGMEMIGGKYVDSIGGWNFTYSMISTIEETLEMFGITLFIYGLLSYLKSYISRIEVSFD